jgi:hypothetical protein
LLIELTDVILDHAQFVQGQRQEAPIHRMKRRARPERVAHWSAVARKRGSASAFAASSSAFLRTWL